MVSPQRRLLLLHNLTSQHREVISDGGLVVGDRLYLPYDTAVSPPSPSPSQEEEGEEDRLPLVLREPFRFELQDDVCGELSHMLYDSSCTVDADVCTFVYVCCCTLCEGEPIFCGENLHCNYRLAQQGEPGDDPIGIQVIPGYFSGDCWRGSTLTLLRARPQGFASGRGDRATRRSSWCSSLRLRTMAWAPCWRWVSTLTCLYLLHCMQ